MFKKYDPIMIPLIKKLVPTTIAQDLISVQPMSAIFSPSWNFEEKDGRWVAYYSPMGVEFPSVLEWCKTTLGESGPDKKWDLEAGYLSFEKRMYVDWFLLRWSE